MLISLFLQVVLFFFAGMRRRSSSSILRGLLWLAYLSADSVAIFVLGHLLVHAQGSRHHLMYFWAPFVLVHLGGQDTITAFSKQDNELWRRHLLNLVMQVAVAGYVVSKASWPDRRLRAAMVIMFLSGCFKYAERTLCLYISSPQRLSSGPVGTLHSTLWRLKAAQEKEGNFERRLPKFHFARDKMTKMLDMMSKGSRSFNIGATIDIMSEDDPRSRSWTILNADDWWSDMLMEFKSRAGRCGAFKYVGEYLVECYEQLHTKAPVRMFLSPLDIMTEIVSSAFSKDFLVLAIFTFLLSLAVFQLASTPIALVLFMAAEKGDQHHTSRVDIIVSYTLLIGAIILDTCSFFSSLGYSQARWIKSAVLQVTNCIQPAWSRKQWSEELAQYNKIQTGVLLSGKPTSICQFRKRMAAQLFGFGTTIHIPTTKYHTPIKELILDHLLCLGTMKQWNITDTRGKLALKKWMDNQQYQDSAMSKREQLEKHITNIDFPISVLILHIATDICYYHEDNSTNGIADNRNKDNKQVTKELSNYIMYLVFKCGVTRTTNSQFVHDRADHEMREIFQKRYRQGTLDEKNAVKELFEPKEEEQRNEVQKPEEQSNQQDSKVDKVQKPEQLGDAQDSTVVKIIKTKESEDEQHDSTVIEIPLTEIQKPTEETNNNLQKVVQGALEVLYSPVLPRAREVARELISIKDEAERWRLIVEVWMEMLYYAAPRCGSAFHYEHLSTGGEFVTHILVLMQLLGPFLPPPSA
jgi:hypothetical protein